MGRGRRLLHRLERHEKAVRVAQEALREAQEGILLELGWELLCSGQGTNGWYHATDWPSSHPALALSRALQVAREKIEREEP